ncbi:MAG TPA: ATP-binding cassette domain-containing protein [Mycobacteriales bacterium]|nr:ATP-binding cassette domain-containing protein [Mycobacteriales bacterium]
MSGPLLQARGLCLARRRSEIVHDVDFAVREGEVVAILGPNGAGKSTLLAGLAGELAPHMGTVTAHGRVALAHQNGALAARSARANVEVALAWWGVPAGERRARAMRALEQLSAADLAERQVATLSGGQRRRVHLARAVALNADLLLLDEPFTALDVSARDALLDDISGPVRTSARAVVLVVHDRAEAWGLADRVVVMMSGRLVADDTPHALLAAPPSPDVARFLGFSGELRDGDELVLTRPAHVVVDPSGRYEGTVTRRVMQEDAIRLDVRCEQGRLQVVVPPPGPDVGSALRLAVVGGARFASASHP